MKLIRIALGSTSPIKMAAVREACLQIGYSVELNGRDVDSGQNEQPVGFEEILRGATTRAEGVNEVYPARYCVGIENGLLRAEGVSIDIAAVVVIAPYGRRYYATSSGIRLPEQAVEKASREGFDKVTVGQVMRKDPACVGLVGDDPHSWVSGRNISRTEILAEAIRMTLIQIPIFSIV